jgi:penicillin amidase
MVRSFRSFLAERVFNALTASCRKADSRFSFGEFQQMEGPLWALVTERPAHLLDPNYRSWDDQIAAAVDFELEYFLKEGGALADQTWGRRNTVRMQHPITLAVPPLSGWLDMPAEPLPGDTGMPRVQAPGFGASERMAVSPGREDKGLFHMPGGQSGHPLSPHYRDGHAAWARGEPAPFLPGPAAHTLTFSPPT